MESWGAAAPEALPLSTTPLTDAAFRGFLEDSWSAEGFPFETPETFMKMGDVELHLSVGILNIQPEPVLAGLPIPPVGLRVQSAVQGTVRFPTGQPDSLRLIAPTHSPHGTGGVEVRWITDLLFPGGIGILGVVEAGFNQAREMTLVAPTASSPFDPARTRAEVEWTPGNHLEISISPRKNLGHTLSIGGGWHFLKRDADSYTPLSTLVYPIAAPTEGSTTHAIALELRYGAMGTLPGEGVNRPFELMLRGTHTLAGSGPWAVKESRMDLGVRMLLRR
jgi:hypothetical protein